MQFFLLTCTATADRDKSRKTTSAETGLLTFIGRVWGPERVSERSVRLGKYTARKRNMINTRYIVWIAIKLQF